MSSKQESSQPFRWHYEDFDDSNFEIRGHTLFYILVLFSIVLFIILVFLYFKWVCRYSRPRPPSASNLVHARPAAAQGLDSSAINSMPIVLYKGTGSSSGYYWDSECCICLGIFQEGDEVKELPRCHHCFHSACVDKWLTTQPSCPICRASPRVDSPA